MAEYYADESPRLMSADEIRTGRLSPTVMPLSGPVVAPPTGQAGGTYSSTEQGQLTAALQYINELDARLRQAGVIQ